MSAETSDDERTLRHFKTVLWPQACRTQDVALLGELLHPSFQMIDGEGGRRVWWKADRSPRKV